MPLFSRSINVHSRPGLSHALQEVIPGLLKGFLSLVWIIKMEWIILAVMDVCDGKGVLLVASPGFVATLTFSLCSPFERRLTECIWETSLTLQELNVGSSGRPNDGATLFQSHSDFIRCHSVNVSLHLNVYSLQAGVRLNDNRSIFVFIQVDEIAERNFITECGF